MKNFVQIWTILVLFNNIEILNIPGNIDSTKKVDHYCGLCFKNHTCENR